ncbi:MAG: N-acetylneuraminate synthase family protein [Deltaproteobacteria bacterium]|nr:N-acetylneuraminate synthase family protein [Deltaproteobacteria bacterium]
MKNVKIENKVIGADQPCFILMDAGVNHNNDLGRAKELIITAAKNGADMVKFQTYTAEKMATKTAPRYWNPKLDTDGGGTQYDTFKRIDKLPADAYVEMIKLCKEFNIIFCSTPFDPESAEFLNELGVSVFKIASADLTYPQLLKVVGKTKKPVMLSTGLSSLAEIEEAIQIVRNAGSDQIVLQHCVLSYPCDFEDAHLRKMLKIQEMFPEIPVGYSDHTYGITAPLVAVALGARSIEKHYTVDKSLPDSPDHGFGLDPQELKELVKQVRIVEKTLGRFVDGPCEAEAKSYQYARKSVVTTVTIPQGTVITQAMLTCKRPGTGIYPKDLEKIVGRKAKQNISEDTTLTWDMI